VHYSKIFRLPALKLAKRYYLFIVILSLALTLTLVHGLAAISLSTTTAVTQNFDGMTTAATAPLPADFKADKQAVVRTVGTYAGAVSATELAGGANLSTSAQNGIYNFGSGTNTTGADRAVGFLSSSNGTRSGNLYTQLVNNTGGNLSGLQISYDVEKYRNGSNPAGFSIQLYYSTDGTAWTSAGATFLTSFSANADNSGFSTAPGATVSISNQTLSATIPNGSNFYLAWNYSVTSGTTTSNAQALSIDNISILGLNAGGATNPTGVGAANPNTLTPGESTLLTVTVTPGTTPPSTGLTVTGNLSPIGGASSQPFFDDGSNGDANAGDNIFSYQATVAGGTTGGAKTLPVTITDAQSRTGSAPIALTVNAPSPPSGTGSANPGTVEPGNSSLLTVTVTPGTIPASTGLSVTADLSSIGGAASQTFFDDGTNGDTVAGNNVFSFNATVVAATTQGAKSLPFTITDAQARSASGSISLSVFISSGGSHNPAEHLVMGNPNGATADTANPNNYLMMKLQYALSFNNSRGIPNWTSWHLDSTWRGSASRQDDYRADTTLPAGFHQVQGGDYSGSGFDRGHMTPSADRTSSVPDNSATFLMTNMIPQAPGNNQGPWNNQENYLRTFLTGSELYIVSGGTGTGGVGSSGAASTISGGTVTVPAYTWKVALILPIGDNDVARVDANTRVIAVIMPNTDNIRPDQWQKYLATVDQVEALSGYDFYSNVPVAIQEVIEARLDAGNDTAPVTSGQSKTTVEDQNVSVTLSATDFNVNNTFTYTIVNPPQHGVLSGSGANRTYTPDPDYFGPDSFTYKANDGALDSNVSTVSITVTAVNDAPVPAIDSKTTQEDTPLSFPASELTANDNPGTANESGQTLSVTAVASNTGGTVSLNAGTVTFTPSSHFSGTASFTYTVCDNGQTNGVADPKCAIGTVNVTVTPAGPPTACSTNVAAASYGATASASSQFNGSYPAAGAIDGNHTGSGWGTGVGWNDATGGTFPDSLIINLGITQQISEIDVYSLQDNYGSPVEPTDTMTFTQYGLTNFQVQTPDGLGGWVDVPDGSVIANNRVKKRIIFQSPISTSQIRILVNSSADGVYSRVVEVEAFSCSAAPAPTPTPTPASCTTNVAAGSYGAAASASSTASPNYPASGVIDGNRAASNWGTGTGWNDGTAGDFPDSVVVNLGVNQSISEVDVYSVQDNYTSPVEPTDMMTFNYYGLTDFQVQVPDGLGGWVDVPGGHVTGNNKVKRKVILATPVVTSQIRLVVNSSADGVYSRIAEVEAFSCSPQVVPTPTPTVCATNVAASAYGATASASSEVGGGYAASGAIDGNHTGNGWGTGVGWNDATAGVYPDSLTINLGVSQQLSEIDVYSLQDNYANPVEPTDTLTFNYYGLTDLQVQIPDGLGGWVDVPGGHVTGNNLVKRKILFAAPVVTNQIRILVNSSADGVYTRVVEIEAFSCTPQAALPGQAALNQPWLR
jgi:endonuclease G, mitochondrial